MLTIDLEKGVIQVTLDNEIKWLENNTYPQEIHKDKCIYAPEYLKHIVDSGKFKYASKIIKPVSY